MSDLQTLISDQALKDYDLLRDDSAIVELPHSALLTLLGEDRKGWLQGQATNDLRKLENGASNNFCLTTVTGHLLSVCEAWAVSDRILLTCPVKTVEDVLRRVEQMVIMEDVAATHVSDAYRMFSIQGPTATAKVSELVSLPSLDAGESTIEGDAVYCLRSNRTGLGGWDLWVSTKSKKAIRAITSSFQSVGAEAFDVARLEAGVPIFGIDMNERTFPPELGPAFEAKHVSYTKGCYMGQEVLMRIHSRGHTNRTWVGLVADEPLERGATISHSSRKEAGTVTSAAFSPDYGYIGAAMLRNEAVFDGEEVSVQVGDRVVPAEVRQMPILRRS